MATTEFERLVDEYVARTRLLIGVETQEDLPPLAPSPWGSEREAPYLSALQLDERTARMYARSIGDDNPLYTDASYGSKTRYGCQLVPGPVLTMVRYPTSHGDFGDPKTGYPIAEFISGVAFEFFDVVRVGTRFRTSKVLREVIEKQGVSSSTGTLYFLVSEVFYWDMHGDLIGKAYCHQIQVPQETLGTGRAMPLERLGEKLMYDRKTPKYTPAESEAIAESAGQPVRRGGERLYWEDVTVGDELHPVVIPPWSLSDQLCYKFFRDGLNRGGNISGGEVAFEPQHRMLRERPGSNHGARVNPMTRWPWNPGDEHEDAVIALYRNQPRPFDFGAQRAQIPHQLISNWMGDDGFLRRFYVSFRLPVYYGDAITYRGTVAKKFEDVSDRGEGSADNSVNAESHSAIGIRIEGTNQAGEVIAPGTATVYLPSRTRGDVPLPIVHAARPPFVDFDTYRKDWF